MYLKHYAMSARSCCSSRTTYIQTLAILGLLLVYYSETEVHFIGLVKVWCHAHDLGESLFGMFKRAVAVIQDTDPIPEFWFLAIFSVSQLRQIMSSRILLDLANDTGLAGMPNKPPEDCPSLDSSDLLKSRVSAANCVKTVMKERTKLTPHIAI